MKIVNKFIVPSNDDESRASLTVLVIDNPDLVEEHEEYYKTDYLGFKKAILDFLGEGEEYNVMPGDLYSRYDVSMLNELILVYCKSKYNV